MSAALLTLSLAELTRRAAAVGDFIVATGQDAGSDCPLRVWLEALTDDTLFHVGMDRGQILAHIEALLGAADTSEVATDPSVRSLTVLGGHDKQGRPERLDLTLISGEVVCIVGPTGAGKSRLLADIECLAQEDTPSGRRILVNDRVPGPDERFATGRRLVAQLSQNMNFVVDLPVGEFIAMHADCRRVTAREEVVAEVVARANELAGEGFSAATPLTQLSGGQTRALMIADVAFLSSSPVVLIDEIENAGIDRKRSLELLIAREKIVLMSTHDPILALMGARRIVIANGAIQEIITTSEAEKANLVVLEGIDREWMALRHRLRSGGRIDEPLVFHALVRGGPL